MDESLWSEKTCSSLISDLPLWIIEYAWSNRMIEVLEVLGPPLWLEGDGCCLSLEDPCSIRVVVAEAWMVIRARDIKHFERVMKMLNVTYTLLPQLVPSIKHMKIMFGLKTLVIMWMLWDDQSVARITDKIMRFFPDNLSQYHRSSRKHMELMQKTQQEFRSFALTLAQNVDMRKTYIRDLMEEQYGERYALKLEERLLHYLQELDKALQQPTCIDQILKQSWPLGEREKLLKQLLTLNTTSLPTALKRLLRCAIANHFSCDATQTCSQEKEADRLWPHCVAFKPSQEIANEERLSQKSSQGSWLNRDKIPSLIQKGSKKIDLNGQVMLKQQPDLRSKISQSDMDPCVVEEQDLQRSGPGLAAEHKEAKTVITEQLCSRHGKKMKSILLECSEELKVQEPPLAQSQCTPPSQPTPILQSTPQSLTQTSASPLQDSSSTNISLSSNFDSSSTNLSGAEVRQVSSWQSPSAQHVTSPPVSSFQLNTSGASTSSVEHVFPTLSPSLLLQQITQSPVFSVQPSTSRISLSSSLVQQESCSPLLPLHPPSSQMSSASSYSGNHITLESGSAAQNIALSQTASSLVQPKSSTPVKNVASAGQQPCSSLNSLSLAAPTPSHNSEQVPGTISQDLDALCSSNGILGGKLKLTLETQGFFLLCKWLQPHVLLCRLSQQQCSVTTQPEGGKHLTSEQEEVDEEGKENQSFDVNDLYSDSESDTETTDDPDYVPS